MLAASLRQAGHVVLQARDGCQGAELFRVEPADLVITDILMPGQEGLETIHVLLRERPGLPVIAISGGSVHSKLYLEMAATLGAHRVLAKPFSPADLVRAVEEVLAARPHHDSPP